MVARKEAKGLAVDVLAAASAAAAHVAAGQADRVDHDALIRLESQVGTLTSQSTQIATDATARAARIEEKVTAGFERVNGTIGRHAERLHDVEARAVSPFSADQAIDLGGKVEKMWSAFSIAKVLVALFFVEQPVIVGLVVAIWFRG